MIILIHEFGYKSVKSFVDEINAKENFVAIIHDYKKDTFPSDISTISLKQFSAENIVNEVENIVNNSVNSTKIGCVTFDENLVALCGLLNDKIINVNKRCTTAKTACILTDKLMMRSFLSGKVREPSFCEYTGIDNAKIFLKKFENGIVLKPRSLYSEKGQYYINSEEDFNKVPTNLNNYLMEEKINYDYMCTSDGIYGSEGMFISIHQYEDKITDLADDIAPLTAKTADMYKTNLSLLNDIKLSTKKILNSVANKSEIIPFHIEWFVNKKNHSLVFCEGAARFGGVNIPELIMTEYGVDIKELYAKSLIGADIPKEKNILHSAISFSPRLKAKKVSKASLSFPNWIKFKKIYVHTGDDLSKNNDWMSNQAYTVTFQYTSKIDLLKKETLLLNNLDSEIKYDTDSSTNLL